MKASKAVDPVLLPSFPVIVLTQELVALQAHFLAACDAKNISRALISLEYIQMIILDELKALSAEDKSCDPLFRCLSTMFYRVSKVYFHYGMTDDAREMYDAALMWSYKIQQANDSDWRTRTICRYGKGVSFTAQEESDDAVKTYEEAIEEGANIRKKTPEDYLTVLNMHKSIIHTAQRIAAKKGIAVQAGRLIKFEGLIDVCKYVSREEAEDTRRLIINLLTEYLKCELEECHIQLGQHWEQLRPSYEAANRYFLQLDIVTAQCETKKNKMHKVFETDKSKCSRGFADNLKYACESFCKFGQCLDAKKALDQMAVWVERIPAGERKHYGIAFHACTRKLADAQVRAARLLKDDKEEQQAQEELKQQEHERQEKERKKQAAHARKAEAKALREAQARQALVETQHKQKLAESIITFKRFCLKLPLFVACIKRMRNKISAVEKILDTRSLEENVVEVYQAVIIACKNLQEACEAVLENYAAIDVDDFSIENLQELIEKNRYFNGALTLLLKNHALQQALQNSLKALDELRPQAPRKRTIKATWRPAFFLTKPVIPVPSFATVMESDVVEPIVFPREYRCQSVLRAYWVNLRRFAALRNRMRNKIAVLESKCELLDSSQDELVNAYGQAIIACENLKAECETVIQKYEVLMFQQFLCKTLGGYKKQVIYFREALTLLTDAHPLRQVIEDSLRNVRALRTREVTMEIEWEKVERKKATMEIEEKTVMRRRVTIETEEVHVKKLICQSLGKFLKSVEKDNITDNNNPAILIGYCKKTLWQITANYWYCNKEDYKKAEKQLGKVCDEMYKMCPELKNIANDVKHKLYPIMMFLEKCRAESQNGFSGKVFERMLAEIGFYHAEPDVYILSLCDELLNEIKRLELPSNSGQYYRPNA